MSVRLIPKFIKGSSEKDAMMKMFRYQVTNKRQCNVISIYESKDGMVTIWFYDELSNNELTKEAMNQDEPKSVDR